MKALIFQVVFHLAFHLALLVADCSTVESHTKKQQKMFFQSVNAIKRALLCLLIKKLLTVQLDQLEIIKKSVSPAACYHHHRDM